MDVILIGYENQENLGLRSIISYLHSKRFTSLLVPFFHGKEKEILQTIRKENPRVVGFSLIFQYTITYYGELMALLRENGIISHFTAGGHFPSLEPQLTFEMLPELDSIIMFEGELTLTEFLENKDHPAKWSFIPGLAFKNDSGIVINIPRPLIKDLDGLPYVFRDNSFEKIAGIKIAHMLASRGCLHNCSFCSIRQFYGNFKGPLRRTRSPQSVVDEMYQLFVQNNVRFFSFQDDDFANLAPSQKKWIHSFLDELKLKNFGKKIRWKISCRADDIDFDTLIHMKEQGLSTVYLGIESGNMTGLKTLNKGTTIEQNLNAIKVLKLADLYISIGFMLFDPSSTFESVRENLNFLRAVGSDGYFPISFCKMLPYAGTPIEKLLKKTNRLKGTVIQSDYEFLDPLMNVYFYFVQKILTHRNFDENGLFTLLQDADFESYLMCSLFPEIKKFSYREKLSGLIARANVKVIDTLERLMELILSKNIKYFINNSDEIIKIAEEEWKTENAIEVELTTIQKRHYSEIKNIIKSWESNNDYQ